MIKIYKKLFLLSEKRPGLYCVFRRLRRLERRGLALEFAHVPSFTRHQIVPRAILRFFSRFQSFQVAVGSPV